jgi:hypothetical protein
MGFSDGERPRAPSLARCVVAVAMDGLLKRLTVQAGTGGRLRRVARDLSDGALAPSACSLKLGVFDFFRHV